MQKENMWDEKEQKNVKKNKVLYGQGQANVHCYQSPRIM